MEPEMARRRVGLEVQRRRQLSELDQSTLSTTADVDPKTIRSLERGDRWPRQATRGKIEKALGWPKGTLDQMLAEAERLDDFGADLPSSGMVATEGVPDQLAARMLHPTRSTLVPEGQPISYRRIADLVDAARLVYQALDDIANGDTLEILPRQAARLHAAATRVAFEWAGGTEGFRDLAETMPPGLTEEISRSPDAAMKLVQSIRERGR